MPKIIAAVEGTPQKPNYAEIFQLGGPAAYFNIVEEINMIKIIDSVFPKRNQGLSIGFYLTLACDQSVNRSSKQTFFVELVSKYHLFADVS